MRELGPFVLLLCACGAAVRTASSPPSGTEPTASAPSASGVALAQSASAEATSAFDALAARAAALAPGMREVARKEGGAEAVELVKAATRDLCVRVAYEATSPVVARLVEGSGSVLAAADAPATEGVLGVHGPVCIRRGDVVRGLAEGAGARVRWMAWEAR